MTLKNKAVVSGLLAGLLCTSSYAVHATTVYPAVGGQWNYGVGVLGIYSDYLHPTYAHGSTVVSKTGKRNHGENSAGLWSNALLAGVWESGANYYYNIQ